MAVHIVIHKGYLTAEALRAIGDLLQQGFSSGINTPEGVIWEANWGRTDAA
jgi:hypothetical protein